MAKGKRVPTAATPGGNQKHVRVQEHNISPYPHWRFSTVDRDGPFRWPRGEALELEIVQKLHEFDSMSWAEIQGKQHHAISVESLSKPAKDRLSEIGQDDIDEVFSFRLTGATRVFGIRDRGNVKLLWYDPDHQVCLSKLKHT